MKFLIAALLACSSVVQAQGFPSRPLRLVLPYQPGGITDLVARTLAQKLNESTGQPVVVDNRPGGNFIIGAEFVAKSAPDGYTILFGSNTGMSGAPALHKGVGYDPVRDFTPISMIGMFPYFLVVNNELPVRTLRELVDYARANPGKLNYASGNAMGIVATGQLVARNSLDMTHVPYKGEAVAMPDLLSNRVQMIFTTGFIVPHVKDGRVRAIVAVLDERNEALPDVPTVNEAGFPGLAMRGWAAVFGPAGLPRDVVAKLSHAVNEALKMPMVKDQLAVQGFPGKGSTPAELGDFTRVQLQSWADAVKAAGIQPD
jgi:tripartite-type tricarboxylate transporter receptor subunit TctC